MHSSFIPFREIKGWFVLLWREILLPSGSIQNSFDDEDIVDGFLQLFKGIIFRMFAWRFGFFVDNYRFFDLRLHCDRVVLFGNIGY